MFKVRIFMTRSSRPTSEPRTASQKMRAYRARLRAAGLRPVQIWVPDTSAPRLARQAKRQSRLVARRKSEREALAVIDAAAVLDDES